MRYETVNTCAECGECKTGHNCDPVRQKLRPYTGIRFTSDKFDCALPVSIDSHSHCSYGCLYCFSDNLIAHREQTGTLVGQTNLRMLEGIFAGEGGVKGAVFREALKYDRKVNGYPTAVQLGALCDPCDNIERQQGWLLQFIALAIKYNQPVRMSTKGSLLRNPEYLKALAQAPHLFWVAFSIITANDNLIEAVDARAPNTTERVKTMQALTEIGVKTSLRLRPMIPGISDGDNYRKLIEMCARAGAKAVSYETMFAPGGLPKKTAYRWEMLQRVAGFDFISLYKTFGPTTMCMRPPYTWSEGIMHAVAEKAHECGMVTGVSDPTWKQLSDTGCCCGILPDDPVFGNWDRTSATEQLLRARDEGVLIGPDDIVPAWADRTSLNGIVNTGVGPRAAAQGKISTFGGKLRDNWNNLRHPRGPLHYFQGALMPVRKNENGDWLFRYQGLERKRLPAREWKL